MDAPICSFSALKPKWEIRKSQSISLITERDLSKDQKIMFDAMVSFYKNKSKKVLTCSGFAGTGKTTVLSCFARKINSRVAYCAFTGKASSVLRSKLLERDIIIDYCGTIHSLIYIPIVDNKSKKILGWKRRPTLDYDLIVIDEGSMVGHKVWNDLQAYHKPILVLGDEGQLSPINSCLNLMADPMVRLSKIHRQAEGSPIIKLSSMIRNSERYQNYDFGDDRVTFISKDDSTALSKFIKTAYLDPSSNILDSAILTYYNSSRIKFNKLIRKRLDFGEELENGDVVICLKNWNYENGSIFNGMRGIVDRVSSAGYSTEVYNTKIDFIDDFISIDGEVSVHQFNKEKVFNAPEEVSKFTRKPIESWGDVGLLFDYGYALTGHKSQGSSFSNVLVYVEKNSRMSESDFRRWLYTTVTRSSNRLVMAF